MFIIFVIAVLSLLILAHEFGHFIVAKKNGIKVEEFAFGFPPKIWGFKKGETTYNINFLPFGGYVKIVGENSAIEKDEKGDVVNDPRSFAVKPARVKAYVLVAGVVFNILLAWVLISAGMMIGTPASVSAIPEGVAIEDRKVLILQVQEETPAFEIGLKMGDQLLGFETSEVASGFISGNKGKEIEIQYKRNNEIFSVTVVPDIAPEEGKGSLGIVMDDVATLKLPFFKAIWQGLESTLIITWLILVTILGLIVDLFTGSTETLSQIMGPVGIVGVAVGAVGLGVGYLFQFVALLSINLAIVNLLPFPALDGGRLLFLLIEKIKGSPVSTKATMITHGLGLIILLTLMVLVTYRDIARLL